MKHMQAADRGLAILVARVLLGVLFLVGGLYKVFALGPLAYAAAAVVTPFGNTLLPAWILWAGGTLLPFVELVGGALVLVGLFTRPALRGLGAVLLLVLCGHLLSSPYYMVNSYTLTRTGLFAFLMLVPRGADRYAIDSLLGL